MMMALATRMPVFAARPDVLPEPDPNRVVAMPSVSAATRRRRHPLRGRTEPPREDRPHRAGHPQQVRPLGRDARIVETARDDRVGAHTHSGVVHTDVHPDSAMLITRF